MTYLRNQISSEKLNLLLIKYWLLVSKFGNLVVDCNCNMFWRLIQLIDSEYATQSLVSSYRSCIAVFLLKFHKIQIKLKLLLRIWLTQIDQNVVFHSISNLWMMEKINLWNTRYYWRSKLLCYSQFKKFSGIWGRMLSHPLGFKQRQKI